MATDSGLLNKLARGEFLPPAHNQLVVMIDATSGLLVRNRRSLSFLTGTNDEI
jgi:hypothetical protein